MILTEHKIILGNSERMPELADQSVQLMVTSPPYPMIKMWDVLYRTDHNIDILWKKLENEANKETKEKLIASIYDSMHRNLCRVWQEVYRVLIPGGIACINIGDATRTINKKFRLFPNHSRILEVCEEIGFTILPYVLWKKTTTKPKYKGKGVFLGSGFLPPNAYVTLDCEFILIFRKGNLRRFPRHDAFRYDSVFSRPERNKWFTQIWNLAGRRQTESQVMRKIAAFPEEIATRLIRMFSVKGDTVLDPFVGSGTTTKVAMKWGRNSVGYEIDDNLIPLIQREIGFDLKTDINSPYKISLLKRPT